MCGEGIEAVMKISTAFFNNIDLHSFLRVSKRTSAYWRKNGKNSLIIIFTVAISSNG